MGGPWKAPRGGGLAQDPGTLSSGGSRGRAVESSQRRGTCAGPWSNSAHGGGAECKAPSGAGAEEGVRVAVDRASLTLVGGKTRQLKG